MQIHAFAEKAAFHSSEKRFLVPGARSRSKSGSKNGFLGGGGESLLGLAAYIDEFAPDGKKKNPSGEKTACSQKKKKKKLALPNADL